MPLIELLAERGVLPAHDRDRAAELLAASADKPPHLVLLEKGFVKEEALFPVLADEFGLEFVDLIHTTVDPAALTGIPQKLVHKKNLMPLKRDNGTLVVATGDPFDSYALDELQTLTGLQIHPVLGSPKEISRLLKMHFGIGGENVAGLMASAKAPEDDVELLEDIEADDSEAAKAAQEATVVGLVNKILTEAAAERASDIHIEHEEQGIKIRYRIDGLLQEQRLPPEINRWQSAIVSRLKIMSRLNIAEKRLPQDGRIKMKVQGREVDVRVSIIPMVHGEGIVMRLLDKGRMVFNLKNIGFLQDYDKKFRQLIDRPHGIVIVTGPTGSGKSTTLYSALNEVKDETTKIITVEDPVEYQQPGICQIQTHAKIGLTFASALRSILRHDPDVVLIGEMRDLETAESAIQASLTGHLVFSTLHTNDAPSAFTRLIDMKVEPFLVASTVEGILAQRLVRTICPECMVAYPPADGEVPNDFPQTLPYTNDPWTNIYKGNGCRNCRNSGYRGRTGIHELLVNTDLIRELIVQKVNAAVIRMEALKLGMRTLRQDGFYKCLLGTTTLDEVARNTAGDIS
jgi:general secretion pathway protein E/type IV pilus assembly protein PilB